MQNKLLILLVVVVVLAVGGFFMFRGSGDNKSLIDDNTKVMQSVAPSASVEVSPVSAVSEMPGAQNQAEVKTFTVTGANFSFSPSELRVKKGDTVKIIFKNVEGFHDWVVDEFNARTPQLQAGNTAEVQFVADKTGTFEYYCSVGKHRAMGMKGNLIVE